MPQRIPRAAIWLWYYVKGESMSCHSIGSDAVSVTEALRTWRKGPGEGGGREPDFLHLPPFPFCTPVPSMATAILIYAPLSMGHHVCSS